jgi:hypothetical protein
VFHSGLQLLVRAPIRAHARRARTRFLAGCKYSPDRIMTGCKYSPHPVTETQRKDGKGI